MEDENQGGRSTGNLTFKQHIGSNMRQSPFRSMDQIEEDQSEMGCAKNIPDDKLTSHLQNYNEITDTTNTIQHEVAGPKPKLLNRRKGASHQRLSPSFIQVRPQTAASINILYEKQDKL